MGLLFKLDQTLKGQPDHYLSIALVILALILILIALYASPAVKAGTLVWIVLP